MRSLLPFWTCWRETVGPHIMSLLQRKAEAENEVVVLRALRGDAELEAYYTRIGFTSRPQASRHEPGCARMSPDETAGVITSLCMSTSRRLLRMRGWEIAGETATCCTNEPGVQPQESPVHHRHVIL